MTRIQIEGMNSVYEEPKISSTIKENPYAANVELEGKNKSRKGEVVLRPDGEALHDVVGKRHYAGGVETWLPEGSFVFSDFKDLAFTQRDHKMFELKEGGSYRQSKNTPAEVLRRNIDVKHYNKMSNTLTEKHKDSISKNTAQLMLNKYQEKLGQIALLQESKKGFPEGQPAFSQGTAPVYEGDLKEDIMEQKQYMKVGGHVLPKYQDGKNGTGFTLSPQGFTLNQGDNKKFPGINGNYINGVWVPFQTTTVPTTPSTSTGQRVSGIDEEGNQRGVPTIIPPTISTWSSFRNRVTLPTTPNPKKLELGVRPVNVNKPTPDIEEGISSPLEMPWEFTPWQKYSMGLGFKNYAGINRLMPMRSQINSPLVELEKMVQPSFIGELAAGFRANQVMNPYLAGNNNAQMYGQMLNANRQSDANYINQNVQIGNHRDLMNNQIQRGDLQSNIGADQQYRQQVDTSKKSFDDLRSVVRTTNQNEMNANVQGNEQLAMTMARMGRDRPFDYNFRTGQIYHTGKGDIMSTQSGAGDILQQYLSQIDFKTLSPELQIKYIAELQKNKGLGLLAQASNRQMKKGGYNPYRK